MDTKFLLSLLTGLCQLLDKHHRAAAASQYHDLDLNLEDLSRVSFDSVLFNFLPLLEAQRLRTNLLAKIEPIEVIRLTRSLFRVLSLVNDLE